MAQSTEIEIIRAEIQELRNKVYDLERKVSRYDEAYEWAEVIQSFLYKAFGSVILAKSQISEDIKKRKR